MVVWFGPRAAECEGEPRHPATVLSMGEQIDRAELATTAEQLRAVLAAIAAGELSCSPGYRSRLQGAVTALESIAAGDQAGVSEAGS